MDSRSWPVALLLSLLGLALLGGTIPCLAADAPVPGKEETPVIRTARSGDWSAPATWEGGKVPGANARVLIRAGHRVVYDVHSEQLIRGLNIAGTLHFATDRDTRLDVGLV